MTDTPTANGDESSDTTRRAVLKAAGATAAVGLASTGAAGTAAASRRRGVEQVPADRAAAETVFDWHAGDLLDDLEADGVVADRSALSLEPGDFGAMVADRDGTAVVRDRDAGVHEVRTVQQVADGEVAMAVEVETGRAYALFSPADTDEQLLYNPDRGLRGSTLEDTDDSFFCFCTLEPCDDTDLIEQCNSLTSDETFFSCACEGTRG